MASSWRFTCTIVIGLEGIVGLLLGLILLSVVLRKTTGSTISAYRFCVAVNAAQGTINSVLLISGMWTHVLSDGFFLAIVYGPIKYAPKWWRDLVVSVSVFMVFSLWQVITAPCIVQYLVLFRKNMTNAARVAVAYLFTAFSMAVSAPYVWLFVPYPDIELHMREIAKRVHQLGDEDTYVVYGIGMHADPANGNRTASNLAFFGILPSYSLTYAVFGFTVFFVCGFHPINFRIVHELNRTNTGKSKKTTALQRAFIRMQLIQGFIPLAILAIPFIFIYFIVTEANLDNWTLMLSFSMWSLPAVQATVYLFFVIRAVRAENERKIVPSSQKVRITLN